MVNRMTAYPKTVSSYDYECVINVSTAIYLQYNGIFMELSGAQCTQQRAQHHKQHCEMAKE